MDFLQERDEGDKQDGNSENDNDKKLKDYPYMPDTYNECKDRFGIIFKNNLMVSDVNFYIRLYTM